MQPHQISTLREHERVSQAVFACHLNVSTGLVSQWERGESTTLTPLPISSGRFGKADVI